jgi:hypothetical protein
MADHHQGLTRAFETSCALKEKEDDDDDDDDEGEVGGGETPTPAERGAGRLYDLGDDALGCVLSFLSPLDIAVCSRVSQRLRRLCRDEDKVGGGRVLWVLLSLGLSVLGCSGTKTLILRWWKTRRFVCCG